MITRKRIRGYFDLLVPRLIKEPRNMHKVAKLYLFDYTPTDEEVVHSARMQFVCVIVEGVDFTD
jgi:hypothetical protein